MAQQVGALPTFDCPKTAIIWPDPANVILGVHARRAPSLRSRVRAIEWAATARAPRAFAVRAAGDRSGVRRVSEDRNQRMNDGANQTGDHLEAGMARSVCPLGHHWLPGVYEARRGLPW